MSHSEIAGREGGGGGVRESVISRPRPRDNGEEGGEGAPRKNFPRPYTPFIVIEASCRSCCNNWQLDVGQASKQPFSCLEIRFSVVFLKGFLVSRNSLILLGPAENYLAVVRDLSEISRGEGGWKF